jgi:CheY-like chemotaxis protein
MDDDGTLRGAIRVALEAAGYEVLEAADGRAGLRLQREQGADLVLVDIFMPERDGLEVIRALRAEQARPTIVAMSGGGVGRVAHAGQAVRTTSAAQGDSGIAGRARGLLTGTPECRETARPCRKNALAPPERTAMLGSPVPGHVTWVTTALCQKGMLCGNNSRPP